MRKVHLITTALGATVLAIGVAQAGPMGAGPTSGMGAPPTTQPSGATGMNGTADQNVSTDTCGDNAATRIPCTHHDTKAKAKAKTKGAASADTNGANANAKTGTAASGSATPATPATPATHAIPPSDTPH
ncbi:MAG TPA: hypothetical protein VGG68_09940 [Caulobacteraceae bacterium]